MGSSRRPLSSSGGASLPIRRESELSPQEIGASTLEFAERCGLGHGEQLHRRLERARLDLRLGRGQRTFAPLRRVRGQRRRALEERGRGG